MSFKTQYKKYKLKLLLKYYIPHDKLHLLLNFPVSGKEAQALMILRKKEGKLKEKKLKREMVTLKHKIGYLLDES